MQPFLQRFTLREHTVDMPGRRFTIASISGVDNLVEQAENEDQLPFWADLWPAAIGLARFLWQTPITNATVMELGAGPGLPGLVAAAKGARVTQTDFIPEALELARYNAACNSTNNVEWVLADWRAFSITDQFDLVIGSDIAYEPTVHLHLVQVVNTCTRPGGRFVLADPGRAPALKLIEHFVTQGWEWRLEQTQVPWEDRQVTVDLHILVAP